MSILELHSPDTLAAMPARIDVLRPEPKFSAWSMLTAAPRGVAAAGAEISASALELLQPFGATMGRLAGETPADDMGRRMADEVRAGVRESLAPSPEDASAAEQVLYGFARGASKIVFGAPAGPAGFALAGGEEALTATRDLQRQGVDDTTALKAGAVQGAGLALAALPLAGRTLAQTAGLYLAGGPGGFVAQQALTREILQRGGYDQIAEGYDPLDPVGLAVSALIPAVFTAAALRGMRKAPADVPREAVDAARVMMESEQRQSSNPAPDAPRAADMHEAALVKAEEQMARGDAVEVSDVAPVRAMVDDVAVAEQRATVNLLDTQITQAEAELSATIPAAGNLAERGAIREARAELRQMEQTRVDTSEAAIRAAAKEIQAREQVSYKAALSQARKDVAAAAKDWQARQDRLNEFIARNAEAQKQTQRVGELEQQLQVLRGRRADEAAKLDAMTVQPLQELQKAVDDLRTAIDETRGRGLGQPRQPSQPDQPAGRSDSQGHATEPAPNDQPAQARATGDAATRPTPADAQAPARPATESQAGADAAASAAPAADAESGAAAAATPGTAAEQGAAAGRLAQVRAQFPDLMVQLDGMDAPMRLDDFLAAVKAEADELGADAPLMQVAAECALLNGTR
jgi:hypothetical protein